MGGGGSARRMGNIMLVAIRRLRSVNVNQKSTKQTEIGEY